MNVIIQDLTPFAPVRGVLVKPSLVDLRKGILFIGWRPRESVQGGASPDRERSDKSYTPRWFRIGMTLPVDPAPFILAADTTHIRAPEAATGSGL